MLHPKDPKRVFKTPGRECSHADRGCCPACFDPMGLLRSTREFRRKLHPRHPRPTTTTQQERTTR